MCFFIAISLGYRLVFFLEAVPPVLTCLFVGILLEFKFLDSCETNTERSEMQIVTVDAKVAGSFRV